MTNSRKIKIGVGSSVSCLDDEEYTLKELGLSENATEEEITKAVFDMVCDYLDWGWSEIEHDHLKKN